MTEKKLALVVAAAGSSTRMGQNKKKEYLPLKRGTVLSESVRVFLESADFFCVVISVPKGGEDEAKKALFSDSEIKNLLRGAELFFADGGATRQESVFNALKKIPQSDAIVLIHDGARPFVTKKIILDAIDGAKKFGASSPGIPPVDTQKEIAADKTILRHLVRKNLCAIQTPQAFQLQPLLKCHDEAAKLNFEFTDDTEIWDAFPEFTGGKKVVVTEGDAKNKKITFSQDMEKSKMIKIGMGTDFHKLVEGRKLFLGGVEIPSQKGELGHSDGDALLHAICDALLGAAGLGDIGSYFPPEEKKWKDADSALLLKKIWSDVKNSGWELNNLDCVVELEKPKFLPWRKKVIDSIAEILETESEKIFVKAKTNETLDAVGSWNAVKTYCVCLLSK